MGNPELWCNVGFWRFASCLSSPTMLLWRVSSMILIGQLRVIRPCLHYLDRHKADDQDFHPTPCGRNKDIDVCGIFYWGFALSVRNSGKLPSLILQCEWTPQRDKASTKNNITLSCYIDLIWCWYAWAKPSSTPRDLPAASWLWLSVWAWPARLPMNLKVIWSGYDLILLTFANS